MAAKKSTKTEGKSDSQQYDRWVILDWNIIQYWIGKKTRDAILPVLSELNTARLRFGMSEISIFEAQCRMPIGKHLESHQFMKGLPHFPVDINTHLYAGTLMSCYRNHPKIKAHCADISLQDVFNATCAILNGALIVTADYEDYPRPFFDEVWRWTIELKNGQHQKIYLLQPDTEEVNNFAAKWDKAAEDNAHNEKEQNKVIKLLPESVK